MIKIKKCLRGDSYMGYLTILIVGLFMAFLLVEAMNRYCLPFVAIMVVIALGLAFKGKKDANVL